MEGPEHPEPALSLRFGQIGWQNLLVLGRFLGKQEQRIGFSQNQCSRTVLSDLQPFQHPLTPAGIAPSIFEVEYFEAAIACVYELRLSPRLSRERDSSRLEQFFQCALLL